MKLLLKLLESWAFIVGIYIVGLILYGITRNRTILSIACGITLFWVLASGSAVDDPEGKEFKSVFSAVQAVAVASIVFIIYICVKQ